MNGCELEIVLDNSFTNVEQQKNLLTFINDIMNSICRDKNELMDLKLDNTGSSVTAQARNLIEEKKKEIKVQFKEFFKLNLIQFRQEIKKNQLTLLIKKNFSGSNQSRVEPIFVNKIEARGKIIEFLMTHKAKYQNICLDNIELIGINGLGNYYVKESSISYQDLETYIKSDSVDQVKKKKIILELLCKIIKLHDNNIYHRNINLKNIKIKNNEPYITDVGNAIVNNDDTSIFENDTDFLRNPYQNAK